MISLRPQGEHAALRSAAARRGARLLALSPWRIAVRDDSATRASLSAALQAEHVLFTSPAAVHAAACLQPLRARAGQVWLAVGGGTARALGHAGVPRVQAPMRMDSEGLLALPALQELAGKRIGFVSAPEGRNLLAPTLRQRGATLLRADVYERKDIALPAAAIERLLHLDAPACVLVSSGGALERVMAQLPVPARDALQALTVIAASERLVQQSLASGFHRVRQADGPRNAQLLDAAQDALSRHDPLA